MAVVTKQELEDAAEDAETLEDVINGQTTVISRLGLEIVSLYQAIQSISSYVDKGAWVTATSYNIKDLVAEAGTTYIVLEPHISGVFATDYAAGKLGVFQGFEAHAAKHENGGVDEVDVTGLSGQLADQQKSNTANLTMVANDKMLARVGGAVVEITANSVARAFLAAVDKAAQRTHLGLGGAALLDIGTTAGKAMAGDDSRVLAVATALTTANLMQVEDQKAAGTDGGSCSAATQNVRDLQTKVVDNITGASLTANQITLPIGTYWAQISAPVNGQGVGRRHRTRLRNVSDNSTAVLGATSYAGGPDAENNQTHSTGWGLFTIAAPKIYELQHYTSGALATKGLGASVNESALEVYGQVLIWKVI